MLKVFNSPDLTQVVDEKDEKIDEAEVVVKSSLQEGFVASERVKESVEVVEDERHQKIVRAVVTIQVCTTMLIFFNLIPIFSESSVGTGFVVTCEFKLMRCNRECWSTIWLWRKMTRTTIWQ